MDNSLCEMGLYIGTHDSCIHNRGLDICLDEYNSLQLRQPRSQGPLLQLRLVEGIVH